MTIDMNKLKSIVKKRYGLKRTVTDTELLAEIAMLRRHEGAGTLYDNMLHYWAQMSNAGAFQYGSCID